MLELGIGKLLRSKDYYLLAHKIMSENTRTQSPLQKQYAHLLINRYQKLAKQSDMGVKSKKYNSLENTTNNSHSYIFNLKIIKNDRLSIIHSQSSLLTKKCCKPQNRSEVKNHRGTTPYKERKLLQKKQQQQKIIKNRNLTEMEDGLNFLHTKWFNIAEMLHLSVKPEQKLQKSNIRQTQASAQDAKEADNNKLTATHHSHLDPLKQTISNSICLDTYNGTPTEHQAKYKNAKASVKQLLKAIKGIQYQRKLWEAGQSDILKGIKMQSQNNHTSVSYTNNNNTKLFFSNQTRKETHLQLKSKIKSHIRYNKQPLSFMDKFISSAITIKPFVFEEKPNSLSSKQIVSGVSLKNDLLTVSHVCDSKGVASKGRRSRRQRVNCKSQVKQFSGWQSSNDFSQRQCFF